MNRLIGLALSLSVSLGGVAYAAPAAAYGAQLEDALTEAEIAFIESIDYDYVFNHVKYISDEIGVGVAGGPAEKRRAEYLAGELEKIGYKPWSYATSADGTDDYFQEVENDASIISIIGGSITINGHEYPANAPNWRDDSVYKGYETPEVIGDTVYFPTVAEAVAADAGLIQGKIVLTHRNTATFAPEARELEAKGALAVVYFYNKYTVNANGKTSGESRFAAPTGGENINIPVILTSYFDGEAIIAGISHADGVHSHNATVRNARNTTTRNILAIKEAAEPTDEFVLIGGHYDSVFGAIGANDNLSGPSSILGIAKAFKDIPTTYNVIFGFWGAEEAGLRGSRYFYANTLAPNDYYKNGVAYYNLDMAATSQKNNAQLTIHTPFRDAANGNAPIKSSAGEIFERQAARYWDYSDGKWGDLWTEGVYLEYYGNCSDHASVSGANAGKGPEDGIPQVYVFWRTPIGTNGVTEYNYHVVGDRYDWPGDPFKITGEEDDYAGNYSIERAEILASAFALSLYESAGASDVSSSISAGARTNEYSYIGEPVEFIFYLENADRVTSVELDFTIDAANIKPAATGLETLNDFTALSLPDSSDTVKWTHLDGDLYRGNVTLVYLSKGGFTSSGVQDILKITREASQLGNVSLTLNKVTVTKADNFTSTVESAISPDEVATTITKTYLIWDLNKDDRVNQVDLNVALSFYHASSADADWSVANGYGFRPDQADLNDDNVVDLVDLVNIVAHYTV
jgi:hypothetical protein